MSHFLRSLSFPERCTALAYAVSIPVWAIVVVRAILAKRIIITLRETKDDPHRAAMP